MTKKIPNIVVLTGAGISAESGIATFRDSNGLWSNYKVEDVATPDGWYKNPELVNEFYNKRRAELQTVQPNDAHRALVKLEEAYNGHFALITQNVDDLHERAGSKTLFHMHGALLEVRCIECGNVMTYPGDVVDKLFCSRCYEDTVMRPNVVWFGEYPFHMDTIYPLLAVTDIFIAIGTSGNVYPAAQFFTEVMANGRNAVTIDVNPAPSPRFSQMIQGVATVAVPTLVEELISVL